MAAYPWVFRTKRIWNIGRSRKRSDDKIRSARLSSPAHGHTWRIIREETTGIVCLVARLPLAGFAQALTPDSKADTQSQGEKSWLGEEGKGYRISKVRLQNRRDNVLTVTHGYRKDSSRTELLKTAFLPPPGMRRRRLKRTLTWMIMCRS